MTKTRYKIINTDYPYMCTCTVVNWLPILIRPKIVDVILNTLSFMQNHNRIVLLAYVIMPSHLHLITSSKHLPQEMAQFKSFTAKNIINLLKVSCEKNLLKIFFEAKPDYKTDSQYQFWQNGYKPKQIFGIEIMKQKITYIHYNPVRQNLVINPEDWPYSSASNYIKGTGKINVNTDWW